MNHESDARARDRRSRISYVVGLVAVCLIGVIAFAVVGAWFWALFSLVGVLFGLSQIRLFRRDLKNTGT